jgi:hypothetical protein
MGLDMFLNKRTYIGAHYEHRGIAIELSITREGKDGEKKKINIDPKKVSEITEQVGYWRKANHIHKWFVDNVMKGEDDCKDYDVSAKQLLQLLALCEKVVSVAKLVSGKIHNGTTYANGVTAENFEDGNVIENEEEVAKLLPTQSGFFFGSTEYNEWYLQDVKDTIKIIKDLELSGEDDYSADYTYCPSW